MPASAARRAACSPHLCSMIPRIIFLRCWKSPRATDHWLAHDATVRPSVRLVRSTARDSTLGRGTNAPEPIRNKGVTSKTDWTMMLNRPRAR